MIKLDRQYQVIPRFSNPGITACLTLLSYMYGGNCNMGKFENGIEIIAAAGKYRKYLNSASFEYDRIGSLSGYLDQRRPTAGQGFTSTRW
ncbi:hypothetical protein DTO271D3_789 [Paecilomyces variotii]|nr:hypothetical protein DTO271D3_789 [Paecilomyces variotii]